jgi:hypothetical protein
VVDASEGYARSKGLKHADDAFMSREKLEELMRKFPDNQPLPEKKPCQMSES